MTVLERWRHVSRGDVGLTTILGLGISFAFVFVNFFLFRSEVFVILTFLKKGLDPLNHAICSGDWDLEGLGVGY